MSRQDLHKSWKGKMKVKHKHMKMDLSHLRLIETSLTLSRILPRKMDQGRMNLQGKSSLCRLNAGSV